MVEIPVQRMSTPGRSLLPMVFKYSDEDTFGTARDAQYSVKLKLRVSLISNIYNTQLV